MIRLNKYEAKQTSDLRITLLNAIEIGDDCHANVLPPLLEIKQGSNVCVCVCVSVTTGSPSTTRARANRSLRWRTR